MAALPPSVLAVLEADRNSGSFSGAAHATRGEWEVPVELAVSGSRQLTIASEPAVARRSTLTMLIAPHDTLRAWRRRRVAARRVGFSHRSARARLLAGRHAADFLRGEVEHLSIDEHGRLMLGPDVAPGVTTPARPFVWTMLPGPDDGVFLGTGNDGKVIRVDRNGEARCSSTAARWRCTRSRPAPNGGLYVGTSPDGRIYRVDAKGQATPFFDPEDKYIWAMAVDAEGCGLCRDGRQGRVYRITPDGKGAPFFHTKTTTHVVSLLLDAGRAAVVGTDSPGRVFRVDAQGKGFLLLDTPYQEVRSLRLDAKGAVCVAAQSGAALAAATCRPPSRPPPSPPPAVPTVSTEITS